MKNTDIDRLESNKKLLELLEEYLNSNPDIRFIQALWNLDIIDRQVIDACGFETSFIVDRFYEEPKETLKRINYDKYLKKTGMGT